MNDTNQLELELELPVREPFGGWVFACFGTVAEAMKNYREHNYTMAISADLTRATGPSELGAARMIGTK